MLVVLVAFALSGSLTITVWPAGRAHASRAWTDVFAPVPPATVCSQIDRGPQATIVRGPSWGRRLWAMSTRRNGCEIERWSRMAYLFPVRL